MSCMETALKRAINSAAKPRAEGARAGEIVSIRERKNWGLLEGDG